MSFLQEFRTFAMRGNAVDLAVGVVIGATFGKVVSSLVNDIIMPPIGALLGGVDFSKLHLIVLHAADPAKDVVIRYGAFLNTVIDFTIVAFAIFAMVKVMNELTGAQPPQPTTKDCPECLMSIPKGAHRCGHCGVQLK